MKEIKYTTIEEQLSLLAKKGLKIDNPESASQLLMIYGYYNIINGYKDPFIVTTEAESSYIPGTTFEQVFSLFILDHNLRNSVMSAMLDLEEHLKAVVADVIASSFGTNQSDYLKWTNYRDRKVKHHRFSLQGILSTLNGNLLSDKDPIRYYREKYGIVPPWILLKGTYFSTLVNFIHLFKAEQKELLIQKLYGCAPNTSQSQKVKTLFSNTLSICLEYRNLAAHGGRVYNYMSKLNDVITYDPIFDNISPTAKYLSYRYGLSKLLLLLEFFSYQKPLELLKLSVFREINEHLSSFPEDINLLEDIISIKIWYSGTVLISNANKIFHVNPLCPALKNINFRSIHYTKISSLGYKPCSICSKYFDAKRILKEP